MKVIISGYYGFGNAGDEAILAVLVEELRGRFPQAELVVLSAAPEETARRHKVRAIDRWDLRSVRRELRGAAAFISGGGGLIQDRTSRRSALYYLTLIALARRHCPVWVIGQGIGPLRNPLIYRWAGRLMRRVEGAMVRDEPSMKLLRHWGVPKGRALLGGDLVLLTWPQWEALRRLSPERGSRSYWVVSLKGRPSEGFIASMARQLDLLSEEQGAKIVFLALYPQQDLAAMEEIAGRMSRSALVLEAWGVDLKTLGECIARARGLVGMRLHALIFALLSGRPFLALSEDPKIENFLRRVEATGGPNMPCWNPAQLETHRVELAEAAAQLAACAPRWHEQLLQAGQALYDQTRRAMEALWQRFSQISVGDDS